MLFENIIDKRDELFVGECALKFGKRVSESPVVPLVRSFVLDMEDVPEVIAFYLIVAPDGTHVAEFIAHGDNLCVAGGVFEVCDGGVFALVPAVFLADSFGEPVALAIYKFRNPIAELCAQLSDSDVSILDCIVESGSGK